jgi:hypothetical protein
VAKKFHTSEMARTVAEVAAMNVRAATSQLTGLRSLWSPAPRKIPMFRRRLAVVFMPHNAVTLKIRHSVGHTIQNLGTPLTEIRFVQNPPV